MYEQMRNLLPAWTDRAVLNFTYNPTTARPRRELGEASPAGESYGIPPRCPGGLHGCPNRLAQHRAAVSHDISGRSGGEPGSSSSVASEERHLVEDLSSVAGLKTLSAQPGDMVLSHSVVEADDGAY